jgi:hypothetical protein
MRIVLPVAAIVFLAACAFEPLHYGPWTKAGATEEEFMKDRYECLQQAQQRVSGAFVNGYGGAASSEVVSNCGVWVSCMGARGYTLDPNGNLNAPQEMVVRCR